jgi:hypothetical protein
VLLLQEHQAVLAFDERALGSVVVHASAFSPAKKQQQILHARCAALPQSSGSPDRHAMEQ